MSILLGIGNGMSRTRSPHLHYLTCFCQRLIEQIVGLRFESAVGHLVVSFLLFFIESENQVLLVLVERIIEPVGGIRELLFI